MSKLKVLSTFLGDYGKRLCKAAFYKIFSVETIGRQTSVYQVLGTIKTNCNKYDYRLYFLYMYLYVQESVLCFAVHVARLLL